MTLNPTPAKLPETRWQRFLDWFRAVDDAFEFDPCETENTALKARLAAMEVTVRHLEAKIDDAAAATL